MVPPFTARLPLRLSVVLLNSMEPAVAVKLLYTVSTVSVREPVFVLLKVPEASVELMVKSEPALTSSVLVPREAREPPLTVPPPLEVRPLALAMLSVSVTLTMPVLTARLPLSVGAEAVKFREPALEMKLLKRAAALNSTVPVPTAVKVPPTGVELIKRSEPAPTLELIPELNVTFPPEISPPPLEVI